MEGGVGLLFFNVSNVTVNIPVTPPEDEESDDLDDVLEDLVGTSIVATVELNIGPLAELAIDVGNFETTHRNDCGLESVWPSHSLLGVC